MVEGDDMATIKDIARELNLGVSTVSMALNDNSRISQQTKQMVLDKARELGYVKNGIAVDLQKKCTNIILFVVTDASRSFFSKTLHAIQERVASYGYDLLIATTQSSSRTAKRLISEHRADGVIIYTNQIEDEFIQAYAREDFPMYIMGHHVEGDYIFSDDIQRYASDYSAAVEYLIAKGHKRIAFVKGSMKTLGTPRRLSGYKNTLLKFGIPYREELVFDAGSNTFAGGYDATMNIIDQIENIDAIYYSNDDIALGGMRALQHRNIQVPDDISIIGSNNLPESSLVSPALTTVDLQVEKGAYFAVDCLMHALNKEYDEIQKAKDHRKNDIEHVVERETVKEK